MCSIRYFLILYFIQWSTCSNVKLVKERLTKDGEHLSIKRLLEIPSPHYFLNRFYFADYPVKINLTNEITKKIREWSPELLMLDATSPYYFSPDDRANLLAYLEAVKNNETIVEPLVTVLPNSYRDAIPLFSMYHCEEHFNRKNSRFFHNVQLIVGPGQSFYEFQRNPIDHHKLICSLYGWPEIMMVKWKHGKSSKDFIEKENVKNIDFYLNKLDPYHCLFVPSEFTIAGSLNNSILLILQTKQLEDIQRDDNNPEPFECLKTEGKNLDEIRFNVKDSVNLTEIGLLVYFYQYLNPPKFDSTFDGRNFLEKFRQDQNASQLIMKWSDDLIELIEKDLFQAIDLNHDQIFNVEDFKSIRKANHKQIQNTIGKVLDRIRQIVVGQYNELNEKIKEFTQQMAARVESSIDSEKILLSFIENLPANLKDQLRESNDDLRKYFDQIEKPKRKIRPTSTRISDQDILFDQTEKSTDESDDQQIQEEEEEEEIIAEPFHDDL